MKKSKAETAETRKRILEVAAQAFKSKGITATGVAEIMAAAGLTHGAFYRHFASKDQLVAEACATSMDVLVESAEVAAEGGQNTFLRHLEDFLSAEYRDDTLGGCPLVAMGSELVRADTQTRRAASQGFEQLIDIVARWTPADDLASARDSAMFTLSAMIGAVTISRILDNPELSDRLLRVTKERLTDQSQKPKSKRAKSAVAA
ncbi:TetR/AcrR family transcriptional regulator [Burkholderia anthina]|uniref:TetR/AcrR family transcriptional regulator n=1 Tax=Burkholderia anthina TaxID=179879 RepID=UPI001CF2137D|nr:TetR/AcrR family transcriptional regulator [Burkholderia anthina]MCA8091045.1 TetR/AcrR family transcriptional regulator [Burkholderia anthina]